MRFCLPLVVVFSLTGVAQALDAPRGSMPFVVYATASEKEGKVTVKLIHYVQQYVQEKVKVKKGDIEVEEAITKIVTVPVEQMYEVDGKKVTAMRVNGKAIEPKDLVKLLEKSTAVLFSHGGKIDPYFEPVYKPDTIVIVNSPGDSPVKPK